MWMWVVGCGMWWFNYWLFVSYCVFVIHCSLVVHLIHIHSFNVDVVDQSWFQFFVPLFVAMVIYDISINLLAFYHQRRSLIGYATHYLFCDR